MIRSPIQHQITPLTYVHTLGTWTIGQARREDNILPIFGGFSRVDPRVDNGKPRGSIHGSCWPGPWETRISRGSAQPGARYSYLKGIGRARESFSSRGRRGRRRLVRFHYLFNTFFNRPGPSRENSPSRVARRRRAVKLHLLEWLGRRCGRRRLVRFHFFFDTFFNRPGPSRENSLFRVRLDPARPVRFSDFEARPMRFFQLALGRRRRPRIYSDIHCVEPVS